MNVKSQFVGLLILIVVALAAFGLDQWGRSRQPRQYTIPFTTGTQFAAGADAQIELIVAEMAVADSIEALIVGHSGLRGDPAVNQELSRHRADRVKNRLIEKGIQPERVKTFGVGGKSPLQKLPDEGQRSYYQRLKRVHVTLKFHN